MKKQGMIVKSIGGFYDVEAAEAVYTCRAKGVLRTQNISPLVGDRVMFSIYENGLCSVDEILPRRNELVRPPVANLDQLVLVLSTSDPGPNLTLVDTLIAIAEYKDVSPIVVITKIDLEDGAWIKQIYDTAGIPCFILSNLQSPKPDDLIGLFAQKITAFTGNTGVGKSSLLNLLSEDLHLPVGDISKKLGRGRHTTRHTELFKLFGGYIADTPGFSMLDLAQYEYIPKEQLAYCFREFEPFLGDCKFSDCSHIKEHGCSVTAAVGQGTISQSRYESYCYLYNEVKDQKEWQKK